MLFCHVRSRFPHQHQAVCEGRGFEHFLEMILVYKPCDHGMEGQPAAVNGCRVFKCLDDFPQEIVSDRIMFGNFAFFKKSKKIRFPYDLGIRFSRIQRWRRRSWIVWFTMRIGSSWWVNPSVDCALMPSNRPLDLYCLGLRRGAALNGGFFGSFVRYTSI